MSSNKELVFVVGGAFGFSDQVYKRSNLKLSLSKMTFSHQMIRLFFKEQLYRSHTILKGEKYHHEWVLLQKYINILKIICYICKDLWKTKLLMISINDLILVPLYLFIIFGLARLIKSNNVKKHPEYGYFIKGLWFKLIGVSFFIIIYLFYYEIR